MKFKKIAIACALATLVTTPVFADTTNFEGLSASVGLLFVGGSTRLSEGNNSADFGQNSQIGIADIGYGFAISNGFVVGTGITLDLGKPKMGAVTDSEGSLAAQAKNHYSVYVQPTWVLNKTTGIYAKLGYNHTKGIFTGIGDENDAFSFDSKFKGTSYGVGIRTFMDTNLFVQVEASLANFKSKNVDGANLKPKMTRATVSLGYRF